MATIGIALTAQIAGLQELQTKLGQTLKNNPSKAKILAAAIEKAILPVELRLREVTPLGPTGNLKRAVASKVVEYGLDGRAVGIVGYKRAGKGGSASFGGGSIRVGPDRAFHQWWLENGTKPRVINKPADKPYTRLAHRRKLRSGKVIDVLTHEVKRQGGYIASSYNELQNFTVLKTPRLPRGQTGQRVQTDPALHCESMVQKGRGRVSTRHTPPRQIWPPAVHWASVVQVARQVPLTQSRPLVQRPPPSGLVVG